MVLRDTIPPSTAFVAAFWRFGGLFLGGIFKGGFRETQLSLRGGTFGASVVGFADCNSGYAAIIVPKTWGNRFEMVPPWCGIQDDGVRQW